MVMIGTHETEVNVAGKMARRAQQNLRAAGHRSIIHPSVRLRKRCIPVFARRIVT
ncbi:hypothetical protein [Paraburkholderia azotifigens]|uniref:Uncharacterized protein n=1 Tax=Paraburkholderia azotifigens TaxID=2057004 RepID=A0ABU9RCX3_9BURK